MYIVRSLAETTPVSSLATNMTLEKRVFRLSKLSTMGQYALLYAQNNESEASMARQNRPWAPKSNTDVS